MTEPLRREFERRAAAAHEPGSLLHDVQRRAAGRVRRRRVTSVVAAVAAVVVVGGAVGVVERDHRPGRVTAVQAADSTPTPSSVYLSASSSSAGLACDSGDYVPDPAPLVASPADPDLDLALTLIPSRWKVSRSDAGATVYSAPQDPQTTSDFIGRLVVLSGSVDAARTSGDYQSVIAGHPASITTSDPCAAAGYQGQWIVELYLGDGQYIDIQGPLSLKLSVDQIKAVAASAVVRKYVAGHG